MFFLFLWASFSSVFISFKIRIMISPIIFPRRRWIDGATLTGCGTGPVDLKTCLQSKATPLWFNHSPVKMLALGCCFCTALKHIEASDNFSRSTWWQNSDDLLNLKWKKKVFSSFLHHKISAILYLTWANRTLKLAFVCAQEVAFCGCFFLFLTNTGGLITEKLPEEKLSLFARK